MGLGAKPPHRSVPMGTRRVLLSLATFLPKGLSGGRIQPREGCAGVRAPPHGPPIPQGVLLGVFAGEFADILE